MTSLDSLPYVDALVKEFLLFRGFTRTLDSLNSELSSDQGCGYQSSRMADLVFGQLIPDLRFEDLLQYMEFLNTRASCWQRYLSLLKKDMVVLKLRLYVHLDSRYDAPIRKFEQSLIKCLLVTAVRRNRRDRVEDFFRHAGSDLLLGPEAALWRPWCALTYIPEPWKDPAFQAHFLPEWGQLLEASFRNFMTEVTARLPLPAILRFNADRHRRQQLASRVDELQIEVRALKQQLAAVQGSTATSGASVSSTFIISQAISGASTLISEGLEAGQPVSAISQGSQGMCEATPAPKRSLFPQAGPGSKDAPKPSSSSQVSGLTSFGSVATVPSEERRAREKVSGRTAAADRMRAGVGAGMGARGGTETRSGIEMGQRGGTGAGAGAETGAGTGAGTAGADMGESTSSGRGLDQAVDPSDRENAVIHAWPTLGVASNSASGVTFGRTSGGTSGDATTLDYAGGAGGTAVQCSSTGTALG